MSASPLTLDALNAMSAQAFVAALGEVFEHAPWVAEAAAAGRPYPTVAALHDAMLAAVRAAPADRQLGLHRRPPRARQPGRRAPN